MLRTLFYSIINVLIPPRKHEAGGESLTLESLEALRYNGDLPYHDPTVRALVWEIKYRANKKALALAGAILAEELLGIAEEELGRLLVVPVPMHKERRRARGYNQTELLSEAALSALQSLGNVGSSAFEYSPQALVRTHNTEPQQTLARAKRLSNVKNSMRATAPEKIKGRVCIVIDDVSTTGATLAEAARALKAAGARRVHTLALARS